MTLKTKFDLNEKIYIVYNDSSYTECYKYIVLEGKVLGISFSKTKKIKQRYDIRYTRQGSYHFYSYVKPKHIFKSKKAAEKYISKKIIKRMMKEF